MSRIDGIPTISRHMHNILKMEADEHVEAALRANAAFSEELQRTVKNIDSALANNTEIQKLVTNELEFWEKKSLTSFRIPGEPYFALDDDQPPGNEDAARRSWVKSRQPLVFDIKTWAKEEEENLRESVRLQYEARLMDMIYGRFSDEGQIRRYRDELMKEIQDISKMTLEELEKECANFKIDWNGLAVARHPKRTGDECMLHWKNTCGSHVSREKWTKHEDKRLISLAALHHGHDWDIIAQELGTNRTPIQCVRRFQRDLNANFVKSKWTPEDDKLLLEAVEKFGKYNWQDVSMQLNGRLGHQCLHRYTRCLDPRIRRGPWSVDEDLRLLMAVHVYGEGAWIDIAAHITGRSDVQSRERYCNLLKEGNTDKKWNEEEDRKLLELVEEHGVGKWATVASFTSQRTDNQCWRRWKSLQDSDVVDDYLISVFKRKSALVKSVVKSREASQLTPDDFELADSEALDNVRTSYDPERAAKRKVMKLQKFRDEDTGEKPTKMRKKREMKGWGIGEGTRILPDQRQELEELYRKVIRPSRQELKNLSDSMDLDLDIIRKWFADKRTSETRRQRRRS